MSRRFARREEPDIDWQVGAGVSTGSEMVPFETIQEMARQIAATFKPERIILFGSYARGAANEHSDVDLLVLLKEAPPPGQRGGPIRRMLAKDFHFPIDVVVRTAQGFAAWKDVPGSLAHEVSRDGKVLYEKYEKAD